MTYMPPQQRRSRERLSAILEATEQLLVDHAFDDISIAMITARAGCSTGSFYARFPSKADLLPALYMRYRREGLKQLEEAEGRLDQSAQSLTYACLAVAREVAKFMTERANLMRAVAIFARTNPDAVAMPIGSESGSEERIAKLFIDHSGSIAHPHPERAVRRGLFMMITSIREALLFGHTPLGRHAQFEDDETVIREAARMLHAYLAYSNEKET